MWISYFKQLEAASTASVDDIRQVGVDLSDPPLDRDFPKRRQADKNIVAKVGHKVRRCAFKPRIAGEKPEKGMGVEQ
jgi:hypothetical protein